MLGLKRQNFGIAKSAFRPGTASRTWLSEWAVLTTIAAIFTTILDSILIQRKYNYFTGGFWSTIQLTGFLDTIAFLVTSFLVDAATIGVISGVGLWVCFNKLSWVKRGTRNYAVFLCSVSPILIFEFFWYQLALYFGSAFDWLLMRNLSKENFLEILVVAFPHLIGPGLVVCGAVAFALVSVWVFNRSLPREKTPEERWVPIRALVLPIALLVIGLLTTGLGRVSSDVIDFGLKRKFSAWMLGKTIELLTDVDRDGYGMLRRPFDPEPWNPQVFPFAVEIPGNGIDENGVGGDLPIEASEYREGTPEPTQWQYRPNIVLILLESFRADAVGAIHNGKPVTPVLDGLAARGVSSAHAFSHNGTTGGALRHIFTGTFVTLGSETTLIDDFKANGYQVAYFSAQDNSYGNSANVLGFDRADVAYDARVEPHRRYTTFATPGSLGLSYDVLVERITAFLHERASAKPLFLYINFYDTHFPYYHSNIHSIVSDVVLPRAQIGPDRVEELRSMYLNTCANIDRAIGEVLENARHVLGEDPAVIVTSDHGESLFDDEVLGHGLLLNDVQTRIPLIVTGISLEVEEPIGHIGLRSAIGAALAHPPTENRIGVVKQNPTGKVFQYLGTVTQPQQIAWTGIATSTTYDFRTGLARVGSTSWRDPHKLSPANFHDVQQLIYFWESMILARNAEVNEQTVR